MSWAGSRGPRIAPPPTLARSLGRREATVPWIGGAVVVVAVLLLSMAPGQFHPSSGTSAAPTGSAPALHPPVAGPHLGPSGNNSSNPLQCDGMYWASNIWATYVPNYCYGHDEPTTSFVSTAAGSGANARYRVSLPADGATYTQGDFAATFWFGGVVYDTASTGGANQAFLEFQFYPAPPEFTGTGSGTQDCLPNGAFFPNYSPGSNEWFACAIVWQLTSTAEDAGFAGPLDATSTTAILLLHSNDQLFINFTGVAQSTTQGWGLSVVDTTTGGSGSVTLQNGSLVLPPYYSTAASGNSLHWGASNPGAISFADEVGHSLNPAIPASCAPGDGTCDSYWPGRYAAAGQAQFGLPVLGSTGSQTFPTTMYFSSSVGGEAEVNASSCVAPSFSTATNCMYPFFQYRSGSYSFTFGTTDVTNATYDYGNEYQFPATSNGLGQWSGDTRPAPWGTLTVTVTPATATVDFNPIGRIVPMTVSAGVATGQFVEGPYRLNVSAAGCTSSSQSVYMKTGASDNIPVTLSCGGALTASAGASPKTGPVPLTVSFTGSGSGGSPPYTFGWTFGDGGTSTLQNPSHIYTSTGTFTATLTVTDSATHTATSSVVITVTSGGTPSCAGQTIPVAFGAVQSCSLTQSQQAVFQFTLTQTQWDSFFYLDVYEADGTVTGTQPVFTMGTGMGGTPSLASAHQTANGPNGKLQIYLFTSGANVYGGWGTYWAIVTSPGGSGGFCFEAQPANSGPGASPPCSASGGGGPPPPLAATATATPVSGIAPLAVSFTGSAAGGTPPYSYAWAFGDGGTSTVQSPSHTYTTAATFTATLTVTDLHSNTSSSSVSITVVNPLSATAGATPTSGTTPLVVAFTGAASGGFPAYTYAWTFGDGGTSTLQNPGHTYSSPGTFTATLTVMDSKADAATSSVTITVHGPLAATAGASPLSGIAPLPVSFTGAASGGAPPYTYAWTFGDGGTSSVQSPSHTYTTANTYTATLTVTDSASATASSSVTITVASPLVASASANKTSGAAPLAIQFTGSASGGFPGYTYSWAFGDGGTSLLQSPTHTYTSGGTFTATLTVTDSKSNTGSNSVTITVTGGGGGSPNCAGQTILTTFGNVTPCHLGQNQQTIFQFTLTQTQWDSFFYIDVYEVDGTTTGTQPVFKMGTGMGGTPSLAGARQTSSGPNAKIQIYLFTSGANVYGGWGTYWAILTSPGGSGGFCFDAVTANSPPGSGPHCSASVPGAPAHVPPPARPPGGGRSSGSGTLALVPQPTAARAKSAPGR